jgi:hypothetical protein
MAYGFVAGHYTATLAGANIGTTEAGFQLRPTTYRDDVRVDDLGDTIVDGVYRGFNYRISCTLQEYTKAGITELIDFYEAGAKGKVQDVGNLVVLGGLAKVLVLTPVLSGTGQTTWTFSNVVPDGESGGFPLATRLRQVSMNLIALPTDENGVIYTRL